jgi:drug/metabolite transporter (DMT)-like permease
MQADTAIVALPLTAASLYAVGALVVKRSSDLGVGVWRTTFIGNLMFAAIFSTLWPLLGGPPVVVSLLWQPAIIAVCLFGAQLAQFYALDRGDISVAVPIFGLKVVFVAFLTPLLIGDAVGGKLWLAALLSVIGVIFLNRKDNGQRPRALGVTLISGGLGAIGFALFDVLVQRWGPAWGAGRLLPIVFWINALFSPLLVLQFTAPLRAIPQRAWPWLLIGTLLIGTQSAIFVSTLAIFGKATAANVIYGARGLLSVLLVWIIGHWFSNTEQALGPRVLAWRLAGALLMLSAIAIVIG